MGLSGKLCREYRHANGSPVGYLEYSYFGDTVIDINTFDTEGILRKTTTQRFNNGLLQAVVERFENGDRTVSSYYYDSNDSLECIVFGAADSTECIFYDERARRIRMERRAGEVPIRAIGYRYFEDEDRLFRVSYFTSTDSLVEYRDHEYFIEGKLRIDHFSSDHSFLGHTLEVRGADGRLLSTQFTAPDQALTYKATFTYDARGYLTDRTIVHSFISERTVYLYH